MEVRLSGVNALCFVDFWKLKALFNTSRLASLMNFLDHFNRDLVHNINILLNRDSWTFASPLSIRVAHQLFEQLHVFLILQ